MSDTFTTTYDLYADAIFRHCYWKCRDRDIGLDMTQETFLRYWICLKSKKKILHPRGLLYSIANNLFIDHVRKRKSESLDELVEKGFAPTVDPWLQTYQRLEADRWIEKIEQMRNPYKNALHSRYILGLGPAEIATMSGETANTVSVHINRGLKVLRVWAKREA